MENRMLIDTQWNWMERKADDVISNHPLMCECGRRKAIMEYNGQRWCKPCAIESQEFGADDFE